MSAIDDVIGGPHNLTRLQTLPAKEGEVARVVAAWMGTSRGIALNDMIPLTLVVLLANYEVTSSGIAQVILCMQDGAEFRLDVHKTRPSNDEQKET